MSTPVTTVDLEKIHLLLGRLREATHSSSDGDMADKIDMDRSTISRLRRGHFGPSIEFVQRAHEYGGLPLDEIFSYMPAPLRGKRRRPAIDAASGPGSTMKENDL